MLYIVAFLCGAIVMAFEIVGSRVMAPAFGSDVTVWASLISTFLFGLAVGGYLGGMLADRFPTPIGLSIVIAMSALTIVCVRILGRGLCAVISDNYIGGRLGPLLAATILFTPGCVLLGMVSPYTIRLLTPSAELVGRIAGRVYALSTAGSIAGTLAAGFALIPYFAVSTIFVLLSALALLTAGMTCITAWVEWKVELRRASVVLLALLLANSPCISKVLYEKDSMYHHIIVEQRGTMRILRFDNTWQSAIDLSDPNKTIFPYTDYIHLALIFNPQIKSVLFVGLGGGTAPMRFHRDYPDMTVHVVEIDPEVKRVAMRYFGFKEDQRMKVFIQDGRMFLRRTRTIYDLIVMDAYHATKYGLSIPFHLTTKEFYQLAWRRLSARGVLAYNLIGRLEGGRTRTTRAFVKTIQSVFPLVYIFPVDYRRDPWVTDRRNIILIATKNRKRISPADIVARARLLVRKRVKIPRYAEYAADIYVKPLNLRNVPLFTDDYAPVEYLEP